MESIRLGEIYLFKIFEKAKNYRIDRIDRFDRSDRSTAAVVVVVVVVMVDSLRRQWNGGAKYWSTQVHT